MFDLSTQILLAIQIAASLWGRHSTPLVITSGNDSGGAHGINTLHAIGNAVDVRTKNLPLDNMGKLNLAGDLWELLGTRDGQFDVVLEDLGGPQEHVHIEYQPHRAVRM